MATAAAAQDAQEIAKLAREGRTEQAMQKLDAALAAKPKDAQLRFLKGVLLSEQNKNTEATQAFIGLTEDYPELAEPWNNLAVLYAADGRYDKARAALELAIKTQPNYPTAYENLGDVYVQLAAQSYEKSIGLEPNNPGAKRKIAMTRELLGAGATSAPAPQAAPATSSPTRSLRKKQH